MSTYVREKVLRIPVDKLDLVEIKSKIKEQYKDYEDDFPAYLEIVFPIYLIMGKREVFNMLRRKTNS